MKNKYKIRVEFNGNKNARDTYTVFAESPFEAREICENQLREQYGGLKDFYYSIIWVK